MLNERYSIEVYEDTVEIYGYMTIEETFDFLNFFDRKGFKSVAPGNENSTIRLFRKDEEERRDNLLREHKQEEEDSYKFLLHKEEIKHLETKQKLEEVEKLLRSMFVEESEKVKLLKAKNEILEKHLKQTKLSDNPEFQKILNSFTVAPPIPDSVHCLDTGCIPRGKEIPEPQGYVDVVAIHRDPMEIPNWEGNHDNE